MNRDLFLVAISLFFWGIGEGMFTYFQPIYLAQWGATPILIGSILGAMGVAILIFQIPAGLLSDKLGSRPLMWASWMFGALSAAVMAFANSLTVFVIGMLMYGLTSFVLAPMNSYIAARRGNWSVGRAITFTSALFNFGMVIGPTVGGRIGESLGLPLVYKIAACVLVISTVLVLFVSPLPVEEHHSSRQSFRALRYNSPFLWLMLLAFIVSASTYLPQPLSPNFLQDIRGLDLSQVGQVGSIGSLGTALIALLLGHLNSTIGILAGQGLMMAFSFILWRSTNPWMLAFGYLFIGGYRLCRAMLTALARHVVDIGNTGLAFGFLETSNALALMIAPVIAGSLYTINPIYVYPGSLILLVIVFVTSNRILSHISKPVVLSSSPPLKEN
jgi:MFS family permease